MRIALELILHLNSARYIILAEAFNYVAFGYAFEPFNQNTALISFFHFLYIVFEAFSATNFAVANFLAVAFDTHFVAAYYFATIYERAGN